MEKKNYSIEVLYDNGVKETYESGEVTESEMNKILNIPYQSFIKGVSAVIQLPVKDGLSTVINVKKITRLTIK